MSAQADIAPLPELSRPARAWSRPETSLGRQRERLAWVLVLPSLLVVALIAVYARQQLIDLARLGRGSAAAVIIFLCISVFVIAYTRLVRVEEM